MGQSVVGSTAELCGEGASSATGANQRRTAKDLKVGTPSLRYLVSHAGQFSGARTQARKYHTCAQKDG